MKLIVFLRAMGLLSFLLALITSAITWHPFVEWLGWFIPILWLTFSFTFFFLAARTVRD